VKRTIVRKHGKGRPAYYGNVVLDVIDRPAAGIYVWTPRNRFQLLAARPTIKRVVVSSVIGTAVAWYDFLIYGTAIALVFNRLFFPMSDPALSTIAAFGTRARLMLMTADPGHNQTQRIEEGCGPRQKRKPSRTRLSRVQIRRALHGRRSIR
jgi:hypothetical protein